MNITTTHRPGECDTCDAYRAALANATAEGAARMTGSACIGLAQAWKLHGEREHR